MDQNKTINVRIKQLRNALNLSQERFGKPIRLSQGYISEVERGDKMLSDTAMELLCIRHGARLSWLRDGEGEMLLPKTPAPEMKQEGEFDQLIMMARRVLLSETHYARSLAANIVSFDKGLKSEQDHEQRIARLERNDGSIRADDPLEKKEELLKLRIV